MLNYRYAEIAKGKRWYIFYMALNPSSGILERKRMYLDHIGDAKLRERYGRKLCTKINDKLDQGWNPFIAEKENRQYTKIRKAFDYLLVYKGSYLSKRGIDTYRSRIGVFFDYLKAHKLDTLFIFEFSDRHAIAFFEHLMIERKLIGRTYNNYLLDFRTFFNFFIKHRYIVENPFLCVDELKETEKEKQPFSTEEATIYRDYCLEHEPEFYVISGLCYYCALRPVEITRLKVSNIDRVSMAIKLSGSNTKNKKNRIVPVADVFWPLLEKYIEGQPSNAYVCSTGFVAGSNKIAPTRIADKFRVIARKIGLPEYVKFYSLKDTAAERLDQSNVSLKTIRDLFGHSNIAVTDAYMRGFRNRELDGLRGTFPPL
jgi:integrase